MSTDLDKQLNSSTTITGTARNARTGAIVMLEDRTPIYVAGLESWDVQLNGIEVAVSGVLNRRSLVPQAVVDDDGAVSHGMDDPSVYVIDGATWELASGR